MSGHSKWAQIKHKKAATDAKRGQIFTKLIKEITVAARQGGGDPAGNARLRTAIAAAKAANMPTENIERAVKKGTGELPGVAYEEVTYEAYGPGGVAIIIEVMTDNKNRTIAELRHIFSRMGGNMGETGCVSWMFTKAGVIYVPIENANEEKLMETVLDAGATDIQQAEGFYEIYTEVGDLENVREKLAASGFVIDSAEITAIPQSMVRVEGKDGERVYKLLEALEEHDDVQRVFSNADIDEEIVAKMGQ